MGARDRMQPRVVDGRFVNPQMGLRHLPSGEVGEPGWHDFWTWRRQRPEHPRSWDVPRAARAPETLPAPRAKGIDATWVGHTSVVLQVDGKTYLVDPVWSDRIASVVKRYTAPGVPWSALPTIDALLVSHDHYDHLDAPTIRRLPRETPVFCGAKLGAWFRAKGFRNVTERGWWEAAKLGSHSLTFVPAQHFSGRTPWSRDRTLWGGWVVEGDAGSVVYFAGDSGWCDAFEQIGDAFPRIDLALIPIGAYLPRWFMAPVHVDPPEAGRAFLACGAKAMMPVHWGTFRLADEAVDEPPRALRRWWDEQKLDPERLRVPELGGTVST